MTGEELSALIKDEIGEDARLHAILDRIRDGKANLTDSELYAAITARITAQQMRRNVLSLDKREAAFVDITRERYTDTFTVFSAVQRILDAANGIHIRPQKPPFEEGRARKIGHSLEDRTVPDSTIERRARSATENFCMSHHDDCMRVNAEFRARAGLQSYAIRDGSAKCCDWCADVSGKYPANETPAGFWGRHDNCKCSILYESKRSGRQLLRGTSKKWEQVAPGAGAEPLVRLTKEQAAAIQERNRLTVLTHEQAQALQEKHSLEVLTGKQKPAIIKLADSEDYWHPITQRSIQSVPSVTAFSPEVNSSVAKNCRELLSSLIDDALGTEGTLSIRLDTMQPTKICKGAQGEGGVKPIRLDVPYISIHNHPSDETFSTKDLRLLYSSEECRALVVIGNSGENVFVIQKTESFDGDSLFDYIADKVEGNITFDSQSDFLKGAEKYGIKYYE